jgi:2-hydroxychromene-2-carboxylate isomerase
MRPVFYFDLGSPYAYLSAERVNHFFPEVPIWQPVLLGAIFKATGRTS